MTKVVRVFGKMPRIHKAWFASLVLIIAAPGIAKCSRQVAGVDCPPSQSRLYVSTNDPVRGGRVYVYCGESTKPIGELSEGVKGFLGGVVHDRLGNIYVTYGMGGTNAPGGLLVYAPAGALTAHVDGLENAGDPIVDSNHSLIYVPTFHYEDVPISGWRNPTGWIPHLSVLKASPLTPAGVVQFSSTAAPRFFIVDSVGIITYWDNDNGRITTLNPKTGKVTGSVFAPSGAMAIGPDGNLYTNGNGTIRIFSRKHLTMIRTFHDGSKDVYDDGPIAVDGDGTLYLSHNKSGSIEEYPKGRNKARAVLTGLRSVSGLEIASDGSLYVVCPFGTTAGGDPGVYVFSRGTTKSTRQYLIGPNNGLRTIFGMTLVPASKDQYKTDAAHPQ